MGMVVSSLEPEASDAQLQGAKVGADLPDLLIMFLLVLELVLFGLGNCGEPRELEVKGDEAALPDMLQDQLFVLLVISGVNIHNLYYSSQQTL